MGRTLPSITQNFIQEEQSFARFRRALRRSDQIALDDLFASARQHLAAAAFASHALPFEVFLLSMLLEEHKEMMHMRQKMDELLQRQGLLNAGSPGRLPGPSGVRDEPSARLHEPSEIQEDPSGRLRND